MIRTGDVCINPALSNGNYKLVARVQMDEWPRLAAAKVREAAYQRRHQSRG